MTRVEFHTLRSLQQSKLKAHCLASGTVASCEILFLLSYGLSHLATSKLAACHGRAYAQDEVCASKAQVEFSGGNYGEACYMT